MKRMIAYKLGNKTEFILLLRKNEFEYNSFTSAVISPDMRDPELASIVSEGKYGPYLIIPEDARKESDLKIRERERLRKLADSL